MTRDWSRACVEMTRDVNTVVKALLNSGVEHIQIKDFHRTGYNLLPEKIDGRADIIQGYRNGPFRVLLKMRDGEMAARKIARRWKLDCRQDEIFINTGDMHELFMHLIRICYLTPLVEKMLPLSLATYNLWGRFGLTWMRRQIRHFG